MALIRSSLLLGGLAGCVAFVLFAGYAIAVHEHRPILLGLAFFVAGAILLTIYVRMGGLDAKARH
jgi:hypothetical protein